MGDNLVWHSNSKVVETVTEKTTERGYTAWVPFCGLLTASAGVSDTFEVLLCVLFIFVLTIQEHDFA
jgi:hypothetical protein